jgi:pyruvate/2-oxoglutarate/acetoin dehydrogenase E1 component
MIMEASALPDPVLILEHIGLYGLRGGKTGWEMNINQHVETEPVNAAVASGQQHCIGKSTVVRGGSDVTLVTWGAMVHLALEAASTMSSEGVEVEVIDVGTLMPFDAQPCVDSVLRTGRLVVLHEAQWSGGLGHTIQSRIMESAFYALEAAPVVVGALDTPVPFSPPLENHTIPDVAHVESVLRTVCQD